MTEITHCNINQFRNITSLSLSFSPKVNYIFGDNGAGKTSLLEALYLLGYGRSFRTRQLNHLFQHGCDQLLLAVELNSDAWLGIERHRNGTKLMRCQGDAVPTMAAIAKQLPLLFIGTESYRWFHDGPRKRRQFLDWGVFHVEPRFYALWQQLQHGLKQRNACLKNHQPFNEVVYWNQLISSVAEPVHKYRQDYIDRLSEHLNRILKELLNFSLSLKYTKGWKEDAALFDILEHQFVRDQMLGFTQYGPHRADVQIYYEDVPAQHVLSQGQQKAVAYALYLAQGCLLQAVTNNNPIYLIDDFTSELDVHMQAYLFHQIETLPSQFIITGISAETIPKIRSLEDITMFHVEHGEVSLLKTV